MIQELLYTSHEGRGLRQGGGGGFCTVLSTEGMASNLATALEKLSGYKHPFDIHDPRSLHNPINFRHAIIRIGGTNYHVLSRIADLRGEHTGRSNKLAHHIVLASADLAAAGPTKLLMHQGFCRESWDGRVRLVSQKDPPSLPVAELHAKHCRYWQQLAGDAGWAGYVAEQLLATPNPAIWVIFPLGTDALALTDEVFSLIPSGKRWSFTFSTYYAVAPPITSCHLRFVLDETSDAEQLRRDYRQVVIDLSDISRDLPESALVAAARTGIAPQNDLVQTPAASAAFRSDTGVNSESVSVGSPETADSTAPIELSLDTGDYELLPPIVRASPMSGAGKLHATTVPNLDRRTVQKRRIPKWIVATCIALAGVCLITVTAILLIWGGKKLVARMNETKPGQNAIVPKKSDASRSSTARATDSDTAQSPVATATQLDQKTVLPATDPDKSVEEIPPARPLPPPTITEAPQNGDGSIQTEPQSTEPTEPPRNESVKQVGPQVLIPMHVLAIPTVPFNLPRDHNLLQPVELPLRFGGARIAGMELIGFEWVAHQWRAAYNGDHLEPRFNSDGTFQIFKKSAQSSLQPEFPLCKCTLKDDILQFAWTDKAIAQVSTTPRKAGLLNGLRWCVLKISTASEPIYVRLSKPEGPPPQFTLFPYSDRPPLITGALPPTIKTRLQGPDGLTAPPNAFRKFGGIKRDVMLHRDNFEGQLKSSLDFLQDDLFQWSLRVKTTLTFLHEPNQLLSGELDTDAQVQLARQNLTESINSLKTDIDSVGKQIGELERAQSTANAKTKEENADKLAKLKKDAERINKNITQYAQLLTQLNAFDKRAWSLTFQQEYENGDHVLIVPIFDTEETVNGQSNAPERFQ